MRHYRKFILSVLLLLFITHGAWADVAFTTVDNSYSSGKLGKIVSGNVSKDLVTNLNGDPAVFSFADQNNQLRLLVTNRSAVPNANDTVWIYNAHAQNWGTPLKEAAWSLPKNIHGVAAKGSYLYLAAYNTTATNGNLVRINLNSYEQEKEYLYPTNAVGYNAHSEAVVIVGDYIYALFTYGKNPWTTGFYENSKLVKLDRDLNPVAVADVGKNATRMTVHGGKIYVVSHGGQQNYGSGLANTESRIDRVDPVTLFSTMLLKVGDITISGQPLKDEFHDIVFAPDGTAYILAGTYRGTYSMFCGGIYKTSAADLALGKIGEKKIDFDGVYGFTWTLDWDESAQRVWCVADWLYSYDKNLTDEKKYNGTALGGNMYSLALLSATNTPFAEDSWITEFALNKTAMTLQADQSESLISTIKPDTAPQSLLWESSNPAVATVDPLGKITAKSAGAAIITAKTIGKDAQGKVLSQLCAVTVTANQNSWITDLTLNKTAMNLQVNRSESLISTIKPDTAPQSVLWHSSNPSVAAVDAQGNVTAKSEGTAIITVTTIGTNAQGNALSQLCTVTVTADNNGDSSGGGCSASSGMTAFIAALPLLFCIKRRKG